MIFQQLGDSIIRHFIGSIVVLYLWSICMTLHLAGLNFNCQFSDHSSILCGSDCGKLLSSAFLIFFHILVSSANNFMLLWIQLGRSFTYSRKSSGPKTEPRGTPLITSTHLENFL